MDDFIKIAGTVIFWILIGGSWIFLSLVMKGTKNKKLNKLFNSNLGIFLGIIASVVVVGMILTFTLPY